MSGKPNTRRKSLLESLPAFTKGKVHSLSSHELLDDAESIFANEARINQLKICRKLFLGSLEQLAHYWTAEETSTEKEKHNADFLKTLSTELISWLMHRYDSAITMLKYHRPSGNGKIIGLMKGYDVVLSRSKNVSERVDTKLYELYKAEKEGNGSILNDDQDLLVEEAMKYYPTEFKKIVLSCSPADVVEGSYYACLLQNGDKLFELLSVRLQTQLSSKFNEIIPKICLLCILAKRDSGKVILEFAIKNFKSYFDKDTVNSILEFAAHAFTGVGIVGTVLVEFKSLVTIEGLITGYMISALRGNQQLLAVFQLYIEELIEQEQGLDFSSVSEFKEDVNSNDLVNYFPPFIYIALAIASESTYATNSAVNDVIEFIKAEPFCTILQKGELLGTIKHEAFIDCLFNNACTNSYVNDVNSFLDCGWVDSDLAYPIHKSVTIGNQKILEILLAALLEPDPKISLRYGSVPLIFRKNRALNVLPQIAERFPLIAEWFVDQISNIPIPLAVPITSEKDPYVPSKLIKGIKLGHTKLSEVVAVNETIPGTQIWEKLDINGQLRNTSSYTSEIDSVICRIPDVMLNCTKIVSKEKYGTNSFMRLLETEKEEIILSPMAQALMEFQWSCGHFWWRFSGQIFSMTVFIVAVCVTFSMNNHSIGVFEVLAILSASLLIIQEFRQFLHHGKSYFTSGGNFVDLFILNCAIWIIVSDSVTKDSGIPPLAKAAVILFTTMRSILHLRILPSVGPVVRIMTSALTNVLPIMVPLYILQIAFAVAFFILHQEIIGPKTTFDTFWKSLQFTLTMVTFDYTMIEKPNLFSMFFTRYLYHISFLISFINLIVALMTVNIADITSNLQAAWFMEVSKLMVELDKFWLKPFIGVPLIHQKGSKIESSSISIKNSGQDIAANGSFKDICDIGIILYTSSREAASKKTWCNDFPLLSTLHSQTRIAPNLAKPVTKTEISRESSHASILEIQKSAVINDPPPPLLVRTARESFFKKKTVNRKNSLLQWKSSVPYKPEESAGPLILPQLGEQRLRGSLENIDQSFEGEGVGKTMRNILSEMQKQFESINRLEKLVSDMGDLKHCPMCHNKESQE